MKKVTYFILSLVMIIFALNACNVKTDGNSKIISNESNINFSADYSTETCVYEETTSLTYESSNSDVLTPADFETYYSIITMYRKIVELCPNYVNEKEICEMFYIPNDNANNWYTEVFTSILTLYPKDSYGLRKDCYSSFGYTIKDLNKDGIEELILRLDDQTVIAVFSMVDKKPILLDNFSNRYNCWIDPDGFLHTIGSNSAYQTTNAIYQIESGGGKLILLEKYGTNGYSEETGETYYYKLVDNEMVNISEEEYINLSTKLCVLFEESQKNFEYLSFIPLFN